MKIEVRNLKVSASLSEETTAYTATIYVNGQKAFAASNRGHGGADLYHPFPGYSGPAERDINEWLAVNEPPSAPFESDPAKRQPYDTGTACDLETVVQRALDRAETAKGVRSATRKLCSLKDGKVFTWSVKASDLTPARLEALRAKHPDQEFVNDKLDDPTVYDRFVAALYGTPAADPAEEVLARLRENRLTAADCRYLIAQELSAEKPTADLIEHLTKTAEEQEAREAAFRAERDATRAA